MLLPSIPMQGDRTELAKKCAELSEGFSDVIACNACV
jgi:hypothetical protein